MVVGLDFELIALSQKRFTQDESIVGASQVKTSVAKAIRQAIEQQMPSSPAILDVLWPKKAHVVILKWSVQRLRWRNPSLPPLPHHSQDKLSLLTINGMPLFFQHYDGPWYPTLRLLHQCMACARGHNYSFIPVLSSQTPICCRTFKSTAGPLNSC